MAPRLRSDIFAAALVRRVFARGDFAAVEARGAEEAGAILVRQVYRDGCESLHGPAPQSLLAAEDRDGRLFETRLERTDAATVADTIARERRFDGDLWVIAVETDDLGDLLAFADGEAEDDGFFRR